MNNRNVIQKTFDGFAKKAGFQKISGSWYRTSGEVISVLNLQKSQYGPSYYINQGFWLRGLGDELHPKPNKCHIQLRLESVHDRKQVERLLNLEYPISDVERETELLVIFEKSLLPFLNNATSLVGLKDLSKLGQFEQAAVVARARELLES